MFRNQENHSVSFTGDGLDCMPATSMGLHGARVHDDHPQWTPSHSWRCMQFTKDLFPEIAIPQNHVAPYHDPKTGKEAPFITMGPFSKKDMLFQGMCTGDLELYTTEEVVTLRSSGIMKSSSGASLSLSKLPLFASLGQIQSAPSTPKVTPHSPKGKPDSSSKRQDYTSSSKSHKHPVSVAAGSSACLWKNPMSGTVTLSADGAWKK